MPNRFVFILVVVLVVLLILGLPAVPFGYSGVFGHGYHASVVLLLAIILVLILR